MTKKRYYLTIDTESRVIDGQQHPSKVYIACHDYHGNIVKSLEDNVENYTPYRVITKRDTYELGWNIFSTLFRWACEYHVEELHAYNVGYDIMVIRNSGWDLTQLPVNIITDTMTTARQKLVNADNFTRWATKQGYLTPTQKPSYTLDKVYQYLEGKKMKNHHNPKYDTLANIRIWKACQKTTRREAPNRIIPAYRVETL